MLKAHTLTEARLYLKITDCDQCAGSHSIPKVFTYSKSDMAKCKQEVVQGLCPSCGKPQERMFVVGPALAEHEVDGPPLVNFTENRSQIIDVGQWLTLAYLRLEESQAESNPKRARLLKLDAALYIEEALKFYDDPDNDLPPRDAFYTEPSRRRFRDAPEQFSRIRLIGLRGKLPVPFK